MIASFAVLYRYTVQSTAKELLCLEVLLTLCLVLQSLFCSSIQKCSCSPAFCRLISLDESRSDKVLLVQKDLHEQGSQSVKKHSLSK